ncbi:MAG: hemerythrin family protein [Candidatus Marinimicrobia bacterium]|nr:hemerythrin family protein [Candidatus Neomarinimicrobiota bacterium]
MAYAEWNDGLSIGIQNIDNQHKRLIEILNELYEANDSPDRELAAAACLRSMVNYAKEHFKDEEEYMEFINYPDLEHQKEEHKIFIAKIADYETAQTILSYTPFQDMLDFLKDWVINHIKGKDQEIGNFLRNG